MMTTTVNEATACLAPAYFSAGSHHYCFIGCASLLDVLCKSQQVSPSKLRIEQLVGLQWGAQTHRLQVLQGMLRFIPCQVIGRCLQLYVACMLRAAELQEMRWL